MRDGGVVADGYDPDLDELRRISTHTDEFLLELERRERERTGIAGLKLGFNRVQGFFIEITRKDAERVPKDYIRRQTVKSAERFITAELKGFEDKVLSARDRALAREKEIYEQILTQLIDRLGPMQATASALAMLDAIAALAERACSLEWTQPELVAGSVPAHRRRTTPGRGALLRRAVRTRTICGWTPTAACSSSPDPTWAVNRPTCARRRSSRCSLTSAVTCPPTRRSWARSIVSSPASARRTTSPAAAPRSWWR